MTITPDFFFECTPQNEPIRMFAHKTEKGFEDIFAQPRQVRLCGSGPVVEVEVIEQADGGYWGWEDNPAHFKGVLKYSMIWPSLLLLKMCFTYGIEAAEKAGHGRRVELAVTEVNHV